MIIKYERIPRGRPVIMLGGMAIRPKVLTVERKTPYELMADGRGGIDLMVSPTGYYEYDIVDTSGNAYRGTADVMTITPGKTREIWCLDDDADRWMR